jgi:hypothetical protein
MYNKYIYNLLIDFENDFFNIDIAKSIYPIFSKYLAKNKVSIQTGNL